ncbi:hypothetical protein [Dyadobacter diqingensis]|uniref:hypothetical protein n=1 Tax=Dyadobacter diqingensis TaxID=2938121 RepID=UPI0020C1AE49|nr:hypothetical protein [Dyadobacter diqingensis]
MKDKTNWTKKLGTGETSANKSYAETHKEKFIRENSSQVYKICGRDSTGRQAYYFVLIEKIKVRAFLRHKIGDTYNIEDYGEIIHSAYGTTVPQEIRDMLKEKYGFDNFDDEGRDRQDQT